MDQTECKERGHNVLDFMCEKIIHEEENSNIVSQTPEKTNELLHSKFRARGAKHIEIYNAMVELFGAMTCSLRLLSLCKKSQTFTNISAQVEVLTKRKFSFRHLAQIKHILPEAIQIDNILMHNKKTLCMEPDLKIVLLFDVIKGHSQQSDYIALRHVFDSRLVKFFTVHPEACDIPEGTLPEPFTQNCQASLGKVEPDYPDAVGSGNGNSQTFDRVLSAPEYTESLSNSADTDLLSRSSLRPTFSPHFSQKTVSVAAQKTISLTTPASDYSAVSDDRNDQAVKTAQGESPADLINNKGAKNRQQVELPDSCSEVVYPLVQPISSQCVNSHACESPLQKLASPADNLMIETPAQVTPKRSVPSCDDKLRAVTTQDSRPCYIPAKRCIDFSQLEGEKSAIDSFRMQTDSKNVLNDEISQDVKVGVDLEGDSNVSLSLLEKLEGSHGNLSDDHKLSQSELVINKEISVSLADLVSSVHHIFQTVNCSSITKQELVHKIIMNNLDIIETREVEEQIELLEKMVPEWICKKLAPGGDIMYNIKKVSVSDLTSIQARVTST